MPLDTPLDRRRTLIAALRDLPSNHRWDFNMVGGITACGSHGCAFAVMSRLWPEVNFDEIGQFWFLGLDDKANPIFGIGAVGIGYSDFYASPTADVTSLMVADALERTITEDQDAV